MATAVLVYYWKLQEHNVRIYEGQQQREEEEFFFLWLGYLDLWFPRVICVSQLFNKTGDSYVDDVKNICCSVVCNEEQPDTARIDEIAYSSY